ncbi:hypothetical protein Bealeia1_01786 [Candidatus Bealeia paramacronuclearis]|uniref:Outer membrane protein beta-barrel domain-containing protein n=1 Tax=Candidatus Bealeia paramacronuclearis TaxID=1921001 RepID=A0ABZ2C526_9PROT|nr:hypothetical protein [Candidatus Bealeia paramacronuclearis]
MFQKKLSSLTLAFLFSMTLQPLSASEKEITADEKPSWWDEGWALTFYSGPFSSQTTSKIFFDFNAQFEKSAILALAVSKKLGTVFENRLQFELEAGIVKHVGHQHHWELDTPVIVARWMKFPWNETLRTTFAIGDGISFASRKPFHEVERRGDKLSAKTLNYLMAELTFGHKSLPNWDFVLRYHHRSGVFGLFDGVHDASNVFAGGIKYKF